MSKQAVNTFKQGLVMDLNPLANDNKSLTNALNATFITLNGNELMLLNDMGNGRINKVRLDDGYIPVGIKEYGGIIYIASYNPKNGKGQIGSFPYPKLEWESSNFTNSSITLNQIYGNISITSRALDPYECIFDFYEIKDTSIKIPLLIDSSGEQLKIRSGDSFSINFEEDTIEFLNSDTISVKLIVKTSSEYYTVSDNKFDIVNGNTFIYDGTYSGFVYLQIDLNTYSNFEVDYIIEDENAIIYPRAYNDSIKDSFNAVILELPEEKNDSDKNISNLGCNFLNYSNSITVPAGKSYCIYPITSDGGYIENLRRELNIPNNLNTNNVSQFKYTVDDLTLKLLYEYLYYGDTYKESNNLSYEYRFYPIKDIKDSINSLDELKNLYKSNLYTLEVIKTGYKTKSGIRYLEAELPENDIYLLVVSCNEEILFSRFIYGTSRYNDLYKLYTDYNSIPKLNEEVEYSLDSNIFLPELSNITHQHYYTNEDKWVLSLDLVKYSEELFNSDTELPSKFGTEIGVVLRKTDDAYIECVPEENYKYVFDKESYTIPIENISINIKEFLDVPLKSSNSNMEYPEFKLPIVNQSELSFKFYRYIGSSSNDGIILLDRILKTIAPVFDPYNTSDELFGYTYNDYSIDSVICSKLFLTDSCSRFINPLLIGNIDEPDNFEDNYFSFLGDEDSLTSGSVKLSNLLSALLNHSSSIFDVFAGGNANGDDDDYEDIADWASLKIKRSLNDDIDAGISSSHGDLINANDDWMIATCLNIKGKPMPINLASRCISKVFDSGYFVGDYIDNDGLVIDVKLSDDSKRPKITTSNLLNLSYINVSKKLQCFLSLIFTLLNLEKNIYLIGPSLNTLNYNIQDNSYFLYTCSLKNGNFTQEIDSILDKISKSLYDINHTNNCYAINYIGSVVSKSIDNMYNYGHLVNLDSSLYNHVLSLYENAYDNEEILDESNGFYDDEIYYLDAEKLYYNSISTDDSYEIWKDSGISFNATFHCFLYDLGKLNFNVIKQSKFSNKYDCLIDWTGKLWKMAPITNSFITVFKALREYSNVLSLLTNNYILLNKLTADIKTQWEYHSNTNGPGIVYIDFGLRGLCKSKDGSYNLLNNTDNFNNRFVSIINQTEYQNLKDKGYYNPQ